jgi:hypothetical protein
MNPNGIKKNDTIIVKPKDGTERIARATKVAPWSKNPKFTVVNWISLCGEWKGKADAKNCTTAPAEAIPQPAAVHPIMAAWSFGKTKRGPQMMEGYYFAAPILHNGKKVGEMVDEGNGGGAYPERMEPVLRQKFHDDCVAWVKANGCDDTFGMEESYWGWYENSRNKGIDAAAHFKAEAAAEAYANG